MNTKFTTDGHTVWFGKTAVMTMIANQKDRNGQDELVILSGWEKQNTVQKLLTDLPYYCKTNKITSETDPYYRPASYFNHLNKLK